MGATLPFFHYQLNLKGAIHVANCLGIRNNVINNYITPENYCVKLMELMKTANSFKKYYPQTLTPQWRAIIEDKKIRK